MCETERILIVVEIMDKRIVIANAYSTNVVSKEKKGGFFQELTNVQNLHFDDIVFCGDFNCFE